MFIITIIIFIPITQQPVHDRLAENQPTAGLSSLNEYENGMRKSETELVTINHMTFVIYVVAQVFSTRFCRKIITF